MSSISSFSKGALRVAKNYTKGYSHTQNKVRDATSNDPWPPSGRQMHEISLLTYNPVDFVEIMEVLDKRLNDKGKYWRHVFKSLTLVDYIIHVGSENVIRYFRENMYIIKTLREFQHIDDDGRDQGANVRSKAKDIVNLLQDDVRLRHERRSRSQMYHRMGRGGRRSLDSDITDEDDDGNAVRRSRLQSDRLRDSRDDENARRALEESKRDAERKRATAEEQDVQRAMELNKQEEEKRRRALEQADLILFDEQGQSPATSQSTGHPLVDATLPLQYAMTGLQPQYTAVPMQVQYTTFDPYPQQVTQEMMQAQYMQQQAEWELQQQALQQAHLQQAQQEEQWLLQQQILRAQLTQRQPIMPQPTSVRIGSNNPFAPSQSAPPTLREQPTGGVSFNLTGSYANRESASSAPPRPYQHQEPSYTGRVSRAGDERHGHLANLFANHTDDGVDTFGNVGSLRFMSTEAGRVVAQKTGTFGQ